MDVAKNTLLCFLAALSCCSTSAFAINSSTGLSETEVSLMRSAYDCMLNGKFSSAIKCEIQALRINRNNVMARRYLGYSFLRAGMLSSAIEQMKIVLQHDRPTLSDMCIYGEACLESRDYKSAQTWFECALKEDSTSKWARNGLRLTQNFQTVSEPIPASKDTKAVVALPPAVAQPIRILNVGNNQLCNAWDTYRRIVRIKP